MDMKSPHTQSRKSSLAWWFLHRASLVPSISIHHDSSAFLMHFLVSFSRTKLCLFLSFPPLFYYILDPFIYIKFSKIITPCFLLIRHIFINDPLNEKTMCAIKNRRFTSRASATNRSINLWRFGKWLEQATLFGSIWAWTC